MIRKILTTILSLFCVFYLAAASPTDSMGNAVLERYNGSGATVAGLNIEAKAFFSSKFDIQTGVTNIFNSYQKDFDLGYLRDSGYIYGPSQPRSITVGVNISI